jgi:hypothetical protein
MASEAKGYSKPYFPRFSTLSYGQAEWPLDDGSDFVVGDPEA